MKPDTLYHYCPSDSFVGIINITSLQLRLSTLALSNDWMEGQLSFQALQDIVPEKSMKLSDRMALTRLLERVGKTQLVYGLGFCLSAERDLLSQWRGYARDGSGVAIGFNKAYLEELVKENQENLPLLSLREILYGEQAPRDELASHAEEIKNLIKQGALESFFTSGGKSETKEDNAGNEDKKSATSQLLKVLVSVKLDSYRFKSIAFREENEYRLLAMSRTEDTSATPGNLQYRAANERILAYATLAIKEAKTSPINEVVLGPKHAITREVVEEFLELNGFPDVKVRRSSASYQ